MESRRPAVQLDLHFAGAGQEGLKLKRHEQIVQRPADLLIGVQLARGRRDKFPQESRLRSLGTHFSSRPLRVERV